MKNEILNSATKLVLIAFAVVLSISVLSIVFVNIKDPEVVKNVIGLFVTAVTMVLSFYFGQKSKKESNEIK